MNEKLPNSETIYRCEGCGGITQTADLSCDCQVPSINRWQTGTALFNVIDPVAAMETARDALENFIIIGCEFYDMDMGENGSDALDQAHEALQLLPSKNE